LRPLTLVKTDLRNTIICIEKLPSSELRPETVRVLDAIEANRDAVWALGCHLELYQGFGSIYYNDNYSELLQQTFQSEDRLEISQSIGGDAGSR
jgi:hypothetical protein